MKKRTEKEVKKSFKIIFILITGAIFLLLGINRVYHSLLIQKPERINIFILDQNPILLSLSTIGESNYFLNFYPDLKINVPGGYGNYRVGALGKLSDLERDREVLNRAISGATLTFIDFYFYSSKTESYFGKKNQNPQFKSKFKNIIFSKSNANFFDRVYIILKLLSSQKNNFVKLESFEKLNESKDLIFDHERFSEYYNGTFFQHTYRDERKSVQILYTNNYNSADIIGRILESNGIRVVDISKTNQADKSCTVSEKDDHFSMTAKNISRYLNCKLQYGKTGISDVILNLGDIEKLWD